VWRITLCGLLMGAADIVPGVSGGTVALVLGIYDRLVTALSHFDPALLALLARRQWRQAAERIDLRFLVALGAGIVVGAGTLAQGIHYLLEHQRTNTLAVFFGLILASSLVVARLVRSWGWLQAATLSAALVFAYWLMGMVPATAPLTYVGLFLCATVAICAMILPGISGAFVLLVLGMYHHVTGMIKDFAAGQITRQNVTMLLVFAAGCAVGLIAFSKFLRWLLQHHPSTTMAALCGFMIGSLRRIWPFQLELAAAPGTPFHAKQFQNVWPTDFDHGVVLPLALLLIALVFVLTLDRLAARKTAADER